MKLSESLDAARIRIPLAASSKEDVLRELVGLLPRAAEEEDLRERVIEAVLEREQRMSTGIGQGVAIPHGKCGLLDGMEVAFGLAPQGIEYDSLDGEPVRILFLLVSPPRMAGEHIQALAQISRMLSSDAIREELASAADAEAVRDLLRREEALQDG